jgi:hypothetical protein
MDCFGQLNSSLEQNVKDIYTNVRDECTASRENLALTCLKTVQFLTLLRLSSRLSLSMLLKYVDTSSSAAPDNYMQSFYGEFIAINSIKHDNKLAM